MRHVPYHDDWGEEHHLLPANRPLYKDAEVLRRIWTMLEKDRDGFFCIFARCVGGWTQESIGNELGITRQAVEQRVEQVARVYPEIAGVLLDLSKRDDWDNKETT